MGLEPRQPDIRAHCHNYHIEIDRSKFRSQVRGNDVTVCVCVCVCVYGVFGVIYKWMVPEALGAEEII